MPRRPDQTASPRPALSRERILRAALELVDAQGIDALTMRALGEALGFEAMSLYNHVANKDDVLDGMLDLVMGETELPEEGGEDWAAAVRASAVSVYRALRRHTWAVSLLLAPGHIRPARLRYIDSLLARLRSAGFSADATYHAYHVLDGFIFGFSLWQASHDFSDAQMERMEAMVTREITTEAYPHLHEHAAQHMSEGPLHEVSAFELGLDLILDGLGNGRAG
jgi:AcrR family transcriptional regulator